MEAAASSVFGQREALGADLTARYWLAPRLAIGTAVGVARRVSRPIGRGSVQPAHDVHGALGVGYELWRANERIGLIAQAGLELARVGFDAALGRDPPPAPTGRDSYLMLVANPPPPFVDPLDAGWWLLARAGLDGRYRMGRIGFSASLTALVPLLPAESDWGDVTSLDGIGAEIGVGAWLAFGSAE